MTALRVICVNAEGSRGRLVSGRQYTVAGHGALTDGTPVYFLSDMPHPDRDIGWMKNRFRPAVERKTDISVFTALLSPARQEERV